MQPTPASRGWRTACAAAVLTLAAAPALAQETFKVGIVSFLSGQAAESFGVPAVNGAKVVIDAFNNGRAPAPYNKVGFGGMKIEPVYVDENGGATKQVQELKALYEREKVDAVVGYVGSGDCLAVAPVAEEMKKFLILYDCGTPRIFEDGKYNYVFRTAAHATMDNVALARYIKARNMKVEKFNMIHQDYAWGQDSRKDFTLAMQQLYKDAKVDADLLPKFGAGQYGTEVSALLGKPADILHSSLWGGDLQAFVLQAGARGVFAKQTPAFSAADHVLPGLGEKFPNGAIIGARGAYGLMSPKSALNDWWWDIYSKAYNVYPVQAPYRMVQALLGLKLAAEKAMAANGGRKPTPEQLAAALKGSSWESPAGTIRMALGEGHQAIQDTAIGRTRWDAGKKMVVLEDIRRFPAECVNPPANMKSEDWLKAGMPGAKC
ncbi:ABC transporter substrate-binding protein [Ramlibacter montanisoli]|uniref:ABC transporter substrate-binding protein n=1 Tax=Ramlibacter montanisoli TaxID=2732512 RepID=A0A849KGN5_9BURK|nr:ABC transporter substrate-binding protein [Ramlibacter montanisoli]NNU44065.1 ABC transporter substrate-binding protein [Ramlibacter montanisoli]